MTKLLHLNIIVGGDFNEAYDPAVGKNGQVARAHIVLNGKKVAAVSNMKDARSNCFIEFRIIDQSIGFPIINVVHDVSSWKVGKSFVLLSFRSEKLLCHN